MEAPPFLPRGVLQRGQLGFSVGQWELTCFQGGKKPVGNQILSPKGEFPRNLLDGGLLAWEAQEVSNRDAGWGHLESLVPAAPALSTPG